MESVHWSKNFLTWLPPWSIHKLRHCLRKVFPQNTSTGRSFPRFIWLCLKTPALQIFFIFLVLLYDECRGDECRTIRLWSHQMRGSTYIKHFQDICKTSAVEMLVQFSQSCNLFLCYLGSETPPPTGWSREVPLALQDKCWSDLPKLAAIRIYSLCQCPHCKTSAAVEDSDKGCKFWFGENKCEKRDPVQFTRPLHSHLFLPKTKKGNTVFHGLP